LIYLEDYLLRPIGEKSWPSQANIGYRIVLSNNSLVFFQIFKITVKNIIERLIIVISLNYYIRPKAEILSRNEAKYSVDITVAISEELSE